MLNISGYKVKDKFPFLAQNNDNNLDKGGDVYEETDFLHILCNRSLFTYSLSLSHFEHIT